MTTAQLAFYVPGLTCSIVGTTLWAWNDFGCWIAAAIERLARRGCTRLRPALVRIHFLRARVNEDAGTATTTFTGYGEEVYSLDDGAPLERKVAFLMEQDRQHQVRSQRLERDLGGRIERGLEEVRRDFDARVAHEIEQLRTERVGLRRTGVALVIVGLVLLALYPLV